MLQSLGDVFEQGR